MLARAEQGRPAVALVAGDAGVGKTRLLAELAAHAESRGVRVLVGGCMEVGDLGLPYVPFVDAFRDLGARPGEPEVAAELAATVPGLGLLLPRRGRDPSASGMDGDVAAPATTPAAAPGLALPPAEGFERVRLFDGVLSLLVGLAELAPLLLVIEDLHWADRSTRDLVAFLTRTLRTGRVALVGSYRSDELHRRHPLRPLLAELLRVPDLERIELRPFTRRELTQYLTGLEGGEVTPEAVDRILARSEGNPFFAEELVAAGATRRDVALPEALADVLRDRVEALPDLAQEVLKVAAVAGRRVSHQLLVAAAGLPETKVEAGLHEAIAAQVLVADPATESYRFRHALLQEVVYGDLLPGERTRLHATYARLLAGAGEQEPERGVAAELAYHALASHDLPGALAALLRASAEATAMSAPAEAARHLEQALELWDQVPDAAEVAGTDRVELLLRAAEAANHSGEFRHATKLTREAIAAVDPASDPLRAAVGRDRLSEFLLDYHSGDEAHGEMLTAARHAVELVPAEPPTALRARVTGQLGRVLAHVHLHDEAQRWCDEALAVARKVGSVVEEARALLVCAVLAFRHDEIERARALLDEASARAATACDRMVELRALYYRGQLEYDTGNLAAAAEAFGQAVAHAERNGLRWSGFGADAAVLRCLACYAVGDWDQAERLSVTVDDRSPAAGGLSAAALMVEVSRGSPAAHERFARLRAFFDDRWVAYLAAGAGADLALWDGNLDEARGLIRFCLASVPVSDDPWALSAIRPAALGIAAEAERAMQARIAGDQAAVAEATKVGEALLERARAAERKARALGLQVGPEAAAWLARAEAEWTRLEGRADPARWAAAVDAFAFGHVYEEARCRWRLAEALLAEGHREEAEGQARAAWRVATRLGAAPLRVALVALARRGRLDLGDGATTVAEEDPAAGALAALTPRELEVLRLVAAGRSNQQIADALFISRKTASVHVSNILGKLDVRTRLEAAALAHRLGLELADA
jgi:DNA-binding CsgD family transcriptional regulator/tetratricopeptide (TPR) repeat protein